MISFKKIYVLYGLEHHTVEISGDVTMRDGTNKGRYSYSTFGLGRLSIAKKLVLFKRDSVDAFATSAAFCTCDTIQSVAA